MIDAFVLEKLTIQAANDGVQQLVIGAIVQDKNKVLLLKRPEDDFMGGIFELPSGKVEGDETLDVALIREVDEETGLAITDIHEYVGSLPSPSAWPTPNRPN
ncbi:MAG TPA: NUDIX domain-containing protein [Pseudonocardiaceae bacterium]|jgi:8-oxo-dGTP diphosphatase|nr:NUDIX domain-containing protein [Pseudonocardiaceae bacterium]